MSRISTLFSRNNHKALIPYVTVGYPSIESTIDAVILLAESGCDIVELGIPFSDPLADGVTIQKASHEALQGGVTPEVCLEVARRISRKVDIPLVFMTYFNPVFIYGLEKFCRECASSGVDGLIIPDLPPDEGAELEVAASKNSLDLIYLLAPNSSQKRIRLVAKKATGFVYLVSVMGVTGARDSLTPDLEAFVSRVRKAAKQPLCIGFGISTVDQAIQAARLADGVIIGSRIIQLMEQDDKSNALLRNFAREIREALNNL